MKKSKLILICVLLAAVVLLFSGCEKKQASLVISTLNGAFEVDLDRMAREEGIDREDLQNCSSVWEFTEDGKVTITCTTSCAAKDAPEALQNSTVTQETFDYSLSDKVDCDLGETVTYVISGEQMLWDHGIVMGGIKSNKTSKGNTTIKLDTPAGSTKTLKGTLSEDGLQFTFSAADNKVNGSYFIRDGLLCGEKGVVLGEVKDQDLSGASAVLTVLAPDGETVTYQGSYMPELKIGSTSFSYEYTGDTLTVKSNKRSITLNKVR